MVDFEGLGWRQGSVLPPSLANPILSELEETGGDPIVVVISHDCDVTNVSLAAEPTFEFLICHKVASQNGSLTFGKNPRRIQFATTSGEYDASIHDRYRRDRSELLDAVPSELGIDTGTVQTLARWLALRYNRVGLPTAFNRRLSQRKKQVSRELTRCGMLSAVFILVSCEELPESEDYRIGIYGTLPSENDDDDSRIEATAALDALCCQMGNCDGIIVDNHELRMESEVTLSDLRIFRRLEVDYLSDRTTPSGPLAPRG